MTRRLAIVSEAPLQDWELGILRQLLGHGGVRLEDCLVAPWPSGEHPSEVLQAVLTTYTPHMVLLLEQHGRLLRAFTGEKQAIDDRAGYVWRATGVAPGVKCMATWAIARVRKEWGLTAIIRQQMARLARELPYDVIESPARRVEVLAPWHGWRAEEVVHRLSMLQKARMPLAHDIEGGTNMGPACYGYAWDDRHALVIPIYDVDGVSVWSEEDEVLITQANADLLEDPLVPKVIQNYAYEAFVEAWCVGITICGLADDTMCKAFELAAELPKTLEFLAMLYTTQPWWKLEHRQVEGRYVPFLPSGRRATTEEWYTYNGTDCMVTYEVNEVMERRLKPRQREHYRWQVRLLAPLAYMALRGLRYDAAEAGRRLQETQQRIYELQDEINREAAGGRPALRQLHSACEALGLLGTRHGADVQQPGLSQVLPHPTTNGGSQRQGPDTGGEEGPAAQDGAGLQAPQQFYAAPGQAPVAGAASSESATGVREHGVDMARQQHREEVAVEPAEACLRALLPLLTSAFCAARRTVEAEVTTTLYQPHLWSAKGKKWVRKGKRVKDASGIEGFYTGGETSPIETFGTWLRPIHTTRTCNVPVEVETLEDVRRYCKDSCRDSCKRALGLVGTMLQCSGSSAQRGELATLLGLSVNINSTQQGGDAQWFVYEHCGAPKQWKREGGARTDKLTTGNEAVLAAYIATSDPRLAMVMAWRAADTRREALQATPDDDGRMRCSYTLPGTDTCRLSCSKSMTGNGYQLQTVTEDLRDLFPADEGCEFGNNDLRGADGYTLAALCAQHGDRTMLEDLLAGIKPVNVIVLLQVEGAHINALTREELLVAQERVDKKGWHYKATKPTFYGFSYLMGPRKMASGIAEDSYRDTGVPVVVTPKQCERIMTYIDMRYPGIRRWQQAAGQEMMRPGGGVLHTSIGWQRAFHGRKADVKHRDRPDRTTHGAWLGTLPQCYTTYATKCGLISPVADKPSLWTDPTNRRADGSLRVEPLHTVHDSLNTQWRVEDRAYARAMILPVWMDNPFDIAGQWMSIPASGTCGPSWGEQEKL